jgi:quercetin dioxygenase-like cupin family protein
MKLTQLETAERPAGQNVFAQLLLEGEQSNVRIIRLGPEQALPPHRHGASDLMLYVVDGAGELDALEGVRPFTSGALAFYRGDEELKVRNTGTTELTLLAFLAPKFPPAG